MRIIRKKVNEVRFNENKVAVTPLDPVGELFILTDVALDIWKKTKTAKSFDDILKEMLVEYDVDKAELEPDLKEFLLILQEKNIIEIVES